MTSSFRLVRAYGHPPSKVWRALTERELLERWLMPNDFEPRVGHRFTLRTDPGPGFDGQVHAEVLELRKPERMVWSWRGGPIDTRVTFVLREIEGGTELTLTQEGFHGVRGWLIGRMLKLGSRTLYGKRLPALLDQLEASTEPDPVQVDTAECMSIRQRWMRTLLRYLPGKTR